MAQASAPLVGSPSRALTNGLAYSCSPHALARARAYRDLQKKVAKVMLPMPKKKVIPPSQNQNMLKEW